MAVTGLFGCYRVYVLLFFAKLASRGSYKTALREGMTVASLTKLLSGCWIVSVACLRLMEWSPEIKMQQSKVTEKKILIIMKKKNIRR